MRRVAFLAALVSADASAATRKDRYPAIVVHHVARNQEIRWKPYDAKGRMQKSEVRRIEGLLRCHHTGKRHALSSRLVQMLYKVGRHYAVQRLEVISGYRSPRISRAKGTPRSYHPRGRAADIRVPGVSTDGLRDYLRTFPRVGVGYYPRSGFVHLDVRDDRSAFWIDRSGPGERPEYVTEDDLAGAGAASASEPAGGAKPAASRGAPAPPSL